MALSQVIMVSLALFVIPLKTELPADEERLAWIVAAAVEAQDLCKLKGELQAALAYVKQVEPEFDFIRDPGDAKAVFLANRELRMTTRRLGTKAWCEQYFQGRFKPPAS
ncbi:hypothetical protein ABLE91_00200 [Aquabacter sp. CN5-332]|uniref:hypothetical protein n=1 Tax=Aquabacter sp. CN5-332 TaxID=3156608 RepID=UPI0032B39DCF